MGQRHGRFLLTTLRGWSDSSSGSSRWVGAWWPGSMSAALRVNSPILLLPPEITTSIFEHCLPPHPRQNRFFKQPWPSPGEAPLLLGQICRQWREICLNTPALWQTIAFDDTMSVELLKVWLLRTRGRPFYLDIAALDAARADLIMRAVMPYSSQWQDVFLWLPALAHQHLHMAVFPRLERLDLSSTQGTGFSIRDAPLLRDANLHNFAFLRFERPLPQLTCLKLSASIAATIAVLRCCPNLLNLYCGSSGFRVNVFPLLELPLLRSLDITSTSMLRCLTVPRLEQLQISHTLDMDAVVNDVQAVVSRSFCELRCLAIQMSSSPPEAQYLRLFRAVDSIDRLKLIVEYSADFERQIRALAGPVDVLPRLKHLEMLEMSAHSSSRLALGEACSRQVLDLLRWRREHDALESFELLLLEPLEAIMDGFRALAEDGFQLRIMTQEPECTLLDTFTHRRQPLTLQLPLL